jgi:hypothetical protein
MIVEYELVYGPLIENRYWTSHGDCAVDHHAYDVWSAHTNRRLIVHGSSVSSTSPRRFFLLTDEHDDEMAVHPCVAMLVGWLHFFVIDTKHPQVRTSLLSWYSMG